MERPPLPFSDNGLLFSALTLPLQKFWPGSAFTGPTFEFAPIFPTLFHAPFMHFLPCLALHAMSNGAVTGSGSASAENVVSCSFLVCHLNYNFSFLKLNKFSIHQEGHLSLF